MGSTEVTTTVTAVDDSTEDPNEEVKVTAEVDGSTVGAQQTIAITDDDTQRVKLSVDGDSEWVMEGGGPKDLTVTAELAREPRNVNTQVAVTLDPHEASPDDFETDGANFQIFIPANQRSASHTFMFKPTDDAEEEPDENLWFEGDTGESDLPVDPVRMMIKDNDGGDDDDDDDTPTTEQSQRRVKLSMDGDSEWVMEGGGRQDVTVKAESTGATDWTRQCSMWRYRTERRARWERSS